MRHSCQKIEKVRKSPEKRIRIKSEASDSNSEHDRSVVIKNVNDRNIPAIIDEEVTFNLKKKSK